MKQSQASLAKLVTVFVCSFLFQDSAIAVDFLPAQNFGAGTAPLSVAVGDLNGDGKPDLAVVNAGGVSVLLGNGEGTFQTPSTYGTGLGPNSVTAGDFNGDGKADLVVVNSGSNDVSVLLGNGDGSLQGAINFAVGTNPRSVAIGDFNGDGKLDLVVTNQDSLFVSVLLGNGDGTFGAAANFAVIAVSFSVAVGDFNGDGKLDVAVTSLGNNVVSVLLGKGDGTFQAAVNFGAARGFSLLVEDFNGDGKPDLAVPDFVGNNLDILLGNGDGTFQAPLTFGVGMSPISVAAGDFNGDGKLDLAVANYGNSSNNVSVLLGNGDGTFQAAVNYATGSAPYSVVVGDFNEDGKPDMAVANRNDNNVSVLLNNVLPPPGPPFGLSFLSAAKFSVGSSPASIAVGDFNRDRKLDLAVVNSSSNTVSILLSKGDGTFQAAANFTVGTNPVSLAVGDFNGDGKQEMVTTNTGANSVSILFGNGDGTFQPKVDYATGVGPFSVAIGDFNVDGKLDLAVANTNCPSTPCGPGSVSVLLGNGDGTFQTHIDYAAGSSPYYVAAGDLNGDGRLDLVVVNNSPFSPSTISVLLGDGLGGFGSPTAYTTGNGSRSVVIGDSNRDGRLDLAVANLPSRTVSILLGNGDGTFQPQAQYNTGGQPGSVTSGDFNGDGKLDLAVADFGGESISVSVLLGNGDGTFGTHIDYSVGIFMASVASGDFNGDGILDLAAADGTSNNVCVLLNAGATTVATTTSKSPSNFGESVTFTATVAHLLGTATPSGTVTFEEAGTALGAPVPLDSSGVGTFVTSTLSGGTHTIVSLYSGDGTFYPSTGPAITQIIVPVPIVNLSTSNVAYGNQLVGTTSAAQSFSLTNSGDASLNIASIVTSGDFAQTNTCGFGVAAGASCTVSVTFTPTAVGARSGTLTITDDDQAVPGSMQTVTLIGTGIAPVVSQSATSLTFTAQLVGSTSSGQDVTLSNTGDAPLTITSIATTGDFAQTNTCGSSVAANASCVITVTFGPAATGARSGMLTITDNDQGVAGSIQTVALTGTGIQPLVTLSASSLTLGTQLIGTTSAAQPVTLTNTGDAVLNIISIGISGTNAAEFSQTNNCGASLAASANCAINVTFTPTATGNRNATLAITDDAAGSPHTVALTGTGTDFTLAAASGGSTSGTVTAGGTANYNLAIAPTGYFGTVALGCTGAPSRATCTTSTNSLVLDGVNPAAFTVSVRTTARAMAGPEVGAPRVPLLEIGGSRPGRDRRRPPLQPGAGRHEGLPLQVWLMALMLSLGLVAAWRRRGQVRDLPLQWRRAGGTPALQLLPFGALLLFVLLWAACGGGVGGGNTGTPPGTYSLTVTATASGVSRSISLTLVVN